MDFLNTISKATSAYIHATLMYLDYKKQEKYLATK